MKVVVLLHFKKASATNYILFRSLIFSPTIYDTDAKCETACLLRQTMRLKEAITAI